MGWLKFTKEEQQRIVLPLAKKLVNTHQGKTLIVGMQGGQGTGKTTISKFLAKELQTYGFKVVRFSIDDFYLSWKKRKQIMGKYKDNPFYQIPRGMPGTHRVKELYTVLKNSKQGKPFTLPFFDKSLHKGMGDITKKVKKVKKNIDFVIIEGWNVGLPTITPNKLNAICKKYNIPLKKIDPHNGRKVILEKNKPYQKIWKLIDYFIQVRPDNSNLHFQWRLLQEKRLIKQKGKGMTVLQIKHFVNIYLPLTYVCYDQINSNAIIYVDKKHNYYKLQLRK